jgi:tryptophan synthase alpha chain
MNRLESKFTELKQKNESALVGFVTAGDPNIEVSMNIITAMCQAGVDILELGIPFSDPTADGPVIQRSSQRALEQGVTLEKVLAMTTELRKSIDIPIILFSYYNPILAFGLHEFYSAAKAAEADGLLVVDLPPEESDEMTSLWPADDLALIRLIAPTTPAERMSRITASASGFLYLVSKTGVTGSDGLDLSEVGVHIDTLRDVTPLPICVGFGISTPADVAVIASSADGVVIGSAFERTIEENLEDPDIADKLADQVAKLKAATKL